MNHYRHFSFLGPHGAIGHGWVRSFGFYFIRQWTASDSSATYNSGWHSALLFLHLLNYIIVESPVILKFIHAYAFIQQHSTANILSSTMVDYICSLNSSHDCSILCILILFMRPHVERRVFFCPWLWSWPCILFWTMWYSAHDLHRALNSTCTSVVAMKRITISSPFKKPQNMAHGSI